MRTIQRRQANSHKFMQVVENSIWKRYAFYAKQRSITVQELIRAIVLPDWLEQQDLTARQKRLVQRVQHRLPDLQLPRKSRR